MRYTKLNRDDYIEPNPKLRRSFRPHLLKWGSAPRPPRKMPFGRRILKEWDRVRRFAAPIAQRHGIKLWQAELAVASFHDWADMQLYKGLLRLERKGFFGKRLAS